ncbi:MAG: DUF5655 domain-containing protein [Candidatus Zixiibacteriota bacterium]
MATPEQATQTQLKNIQTRTGKTLEQLAKIIKESGLTKHGELRSMLQQKLGMGYGDANTLVHYVLKSDGASAAKKGAMSEDDVLNGIYSGPKEALRPIHDSLMKHIKNFGEFEIAPKKGYVSLRRKKQFAMIGPATNSRVEVGLNVKGLPAAGRLEAIPPGGMCNYKVKLTEVSQVDKELIGWIKLAFENAG